MPDSDFTPMMGVLALLLLGVMLVLVGVGVAVGLVCAACVAVMMALGMVSTSVLLALLRRQISTGFRTLHYQGVIFGGLMSGTATAWVGAGVLGLPLRQRDVLLIGMAGGVAAGTLIAFALDYAARLACRRWSGSSILAKISGRMDE